MPLNNSSQTVHTKDYPPLGSAKVKLNARKQAKAAHTRKMNEIQNHLQVRLIPPERFTDLVKDLKKLFLACEKAHNELFNAADFVKHPDKDDSQWLADVKGAQDELIAAKNNYMQKSVRRETRKVQKSDDTTAAGAAPPLVPELTTNAIVQLRARLNQLDDQQIEAQIHAENDDENDRVDSQTENEEGNSGEEDDRSSVSTPQNHFQTPASRDQAELRQHLKRADNFAKKDDELDSADPLLGGLTLNDLRLFNRPILTASEGGRRLTRGGGGFARVGGSFGGCGGSFGGCGGAGSSVSSKTKRQLHEEQQKRMFLEQLMDQLQEDAAAFRERATMEKLNNQMQIRQLAEALNINAEKLQGQIAAGKLAESKHKEELKKLQDDMKTLESSSRTDYEALLQQINSRLSDIESKPRTEPKIGGKGLKRSSVKEDGKEEKEEEDDAVDTLLNMLTRRLSEKEKGTGAIPKRADGSSRWTFPSLLSPTKSSAKVEEVKSPSHSHASSGTTSRSIFRVPKPNLIPFDGDPKKYPAWIAQFEDVIDSDMSLTSVQKMALLKLCLTEDMKDNLGDTLNDPMMYNEALKQLANTFGNPILVSKSYVHTLMNLPKVTSMQDYQGLMSLSNKLKGAVASLKYGGFERELVSSSTLESVLCKLPDEFQIKWGQQVMKNLPKPLTLIEFCDWFSSKMLGQMFVKHARYSSTAVVKDRKGSKDEKGGKPSSKVLNVAIGSADSTADKKKERTKPSCCCCKEAHWTSKCKEFANKPVAERAEIARSNGLCFRCLNKGHMKNDCPFSKLRCQVEKCNYRHHTLLHGSAAPKRSKEKEPTAADGKKTVSVKSTDAAKGGKGADVSSLAVSGSENTVLLGIVPIVLRYSDKAVHTYAVLDNGSETTLITKTISEELGIDGPTQLRRFKWFDHHEEEKEVKMVNFTFANESGSKSFDVKNGFIVERLTISERKCDWPTIKTQYDHLSLLDLPAIDSSLVTVLIGRDVRDANDILKYAKPPSGVDAPEAILTHFGWCVIGPVPDRLFSHDIFYDATSVCKVSVVPTDTEMKDLIERFWSTESFGVTPTEVTKYTAKEQRALDILESTFKNLGGKCQVGFPWATDNPYFPNNRDVALRAFEQLERRFERDPEYAKMFDVQIQEYISLNFVKRIETPEQHPPKMLFYLIPHGVEHPHKPGRKRVVFNGSRKFQGVSLNSQLLAGPNLLNSCVGVLLQMREKPVFVSCNIAKYYDQILVPPEEQSVQRIFYRPPGSKDPIGEYQIIVYFFGNIASPVVANNALRRTAQGMAAKYPDAAKILKEN